MECDIRIRIAGVIEKAYPALFFLFCFSVPFLKPVSIAALVLLLVLFILQSLLGVKLQRGNRWYFLSVLQYIFLIALSLSYTQNMNFGSRSIRFCIIALLSVILVEKLQSKAMALQFLRVFIAGGTMLSLILIYEGVVKHVIRPSHVWHAVHAGNLLLLSLVATVALLLGAGSLRRWVVYAVVVAVQLYAFYLNGTRGAWIAFAVIIACIPFLLLQIRTLWKTGYIVTLVLAGILVTRGEHFQAKFHEAVTDVKQYREGVSSTSLGGRFEMWGASARMFMEHPLLGVGAGDWVDEFQKKARESKSAAYLLQFNQPHNIYLEALSTRGLMGLTSLLLFVLYPVVHVWKSRCRETAVFRNLVLMSVLAMLVSGLTDTLTNVRFVFMAYCALIGIGMSAFSNSNVAAEQCKNV